MSQKVLGTAVYPVEINDEINVGADIVVADGTSETDVYPVDGVSLGDFVDVAVICPSPIPNPTTWVEPAAEIVVTARVDSADSIRVTFTNTRVGGADLTIPEDSKIFVKVRVRADGTLPQVP